MKTRLLLTAATAAMLLGACSSEENTTSADRSAKREKQSGLDGLQNHASSGLRQTFTFNAGREKVTLTSERGVRINIDPRELKLNGHPVSGTVTVEYVEIFDRGNMITANKTTMGISDVAPEGLQDMASDAASDAQEPVKLPLKSGGEFFVNMKQENQPLDDGSHYQLVVPSELTGGPDDEMIGWKGDQDQADDDGDGAPDPKNDVTWDKETDGGGNDTDVPVNPDGDYVLDLFKFGWSNIDRFKSDPGPKTMLYVDVPAGYDNTNAKVYFAYPTDNTVALLDEYDPMTGHFYEHYGWVPTGINAYLIFVSEQSGQWYYGVKSITVGTNSVETFTTGDLSLATSSALISMLNGLP